MNQLTTQSPAPPKSDDEGLTPQQIRWIPIVVPLAGLLLALVGLAVLSVA
jgi:hypothetical protein